MGQYAAVGAAIIAAFFAGSVALSHAQTEGPWAGVGVMPAWPVWKQAHTTDQSMAVIVNTHTGQIRMCGDNSGICATTSLK